MVISSCTSHLCHERDEIHYEMVSGNEAKKKDYENYNRDSFEYTYVYPIMQV